jgi:cobalamin biosynthesis protein CbiD
MLIGHTGITQPLSAHALLAAMIAEVNAMSVRVDLLKYHAPKVYGGVVV